MFGLNRTMQYGNAIFLPIFFLSPAGLNRTMQYGNFLLFSFPQAGLTGLNRTMQYGNGYTNAGESQELWGFKSYYVVWKHVSDNLGLLGDKSLNRTMQYGNSPPEHFRPTVPQV